MKRRDFFTFSSGAVFAGVLARSTAFAQSRYPERAIRLVVPYAPGGVVDAVSGAYMRNTGVRITADVLKMLTTWGWRT